MTHSPLINIAVTPKTKADEENLYTALQKLMAEDPTLRVSDPKAGQIIVGGVGELQLEIVCDRLGREFGIEALLGKPAIVYKETVTQSDDGEVKSVVLEPIMRLEVIVPNEYADDVIRNLTSRRGKIQLREDRGGRHIIQAHVPLSEMFGYATDLRERSLGRAAYSLHFDRYEPMPDTSTDSGAGVREPVVNPRGGRSFGAESSMEDI